MSHGAADAMRPRGSVERTCACGWSSWHDPLSAGAAAVPFVCAGCRDDPELGCRCSACNRWFRARHRALAAMGHHKRCPDCAGIPPMHFAAEVHCCGCTCGSGLPGGGACHGPATREVRWPKGCDCEACWQTRYRVCDACAADWLHDKTPEEQRAIMRRRGARVVELGGGAWTFEWPAPSDN